MPDAPPIPRKSRGSRLELRTDPHWPRSAREVATQSARHHCGREWATEVARRKKSESSKRNSSLFKKERLGEQALSLLTT